MVIVNLNANAGLPQSLSDFPFAQGTVEEKNKLRRL